MSKTKYICTNCDTINHIKDNIPDEEMNCWFCKKYTLVEDEQ